jgi:hypothetical protein
MKILTICSTLDFQNFTRRATIEAISEKVHTLNVLFYLSIRSQFARITKPKKIKSYCYYRWFPEKLFKKQLFKYIEIAIRRKYWSKVFQNYEFIFFYRSKPGVFIRIL